MTVCENFLEECSEVKTDKIVIVSGENNRKLTLNNPDQKKIRVINIDRLTAKCGYKGKKCDAIVEVINPSNNRLEQIIATEFKRRSNESAAEQLEESLLHDFVKKRRGNKNCCGYVVGQGAPSLSGGAQKILVNFKRKCDANLKFASCSNHKITV